MMDQQWQTDAAALIAKLANCIDGDMKNVGGGTSLGFDGRLTAGMIREAKRLTLNEQKDTAA